MELTNLKFNVDTAALQSAVNLVSVLGDAVQELGRDVQVLATADKNASAAALLQAKARRENALAAKAEAGATQVATKAKKASVEVVEASTKAAKSNVDMLQRQRDIFDFMGQGFSKGQASILATAKATGQLSAELENVLQAQRRLQGGDPFDKSLGAIVRVKNEYAELRDQMRMASAEVELTSKQYRELTRAKLGIIEVMKSQGASFSDIRNKIRELNHEYIQLATVNNRMLAAEKENEKQAKKTANTLIDQAKSTSFLENELIRAERALEGLNNELFVSTSNRILKFEQQLKSSGMTLADQVAMLEKYKKTLTETDRIRTSKGHVGTDQSNRQVELLARSLAPQISDVAVSLAGGMNPFTVLMQQGLQVRDLMQLSGVEAERMGEAFRKAGSGMISTSVAAAGAIGSMLGGAIVDAGKYVLSFGAGIGGLDRKIRDLSLALAITSDSANGPFAKSVADASLGVLRFIPVVAGLMTVLAGAGVLSLLGATVTVAKEQSALSIALATTGASLGLTKNQAVDLAGSLKDVSASKATSVLTEMAKAGGFTQEQFGMVAEAAAKMQKYVGQDIETTVSQFKELQKDPAKALAEFASGNGLVEVSVLKKVKQLQDDKKYTEAATIAAEAHAQALVSVAGIVESEMHPLTTIWVDMKSAIGSVWEEIKELARTEVVLKTVRGAFDTVRGVVYDLWMFVKGVGKSIGGLGAIAGAVISGDFSGAKSIAADMMRDVSQGLKDREQYMKGLYNFERKADKELNTDRKKNAKDAEAFIRGLKKEPKGAKSQAQKDQEEAEKFVKASIGKLREDYLQAALAQLDLTQAYEEFVKIANNPVWQRLSSDQQKQIEQQFSLANATQLLNREIEKQAKIREQSQKESFEAEVKRLDISSDLDIKLRDELESVQEESRELQYQASIIGEISSERSKLLQIRKVELDLQKKIREIERSSLDDTDKSSKIAAAKAIANAQISSITQVAINDLNQKLVDGVTESVMTGLIQGGKAGSKSLRDLIVAELQKPIRVFVQATVSSLMGGVGGSGVGSMLSTAGQFLGLSEGAAGMLGAAGSALSGFAGTAAAGARMAATGGYSTAIGAAGSMGTAGNIAMQAGARGVTGAAGYAAYKGISGGYETNALVDTIGKFAGFFGSTGIVVSAIAGGINRAFGRKLTEQGVRANITNGQVSGVENYQFEKGGIFRSDKTTTSAASAGTVSQVTRDAEAIKMQAVGMANALGLNSQAVESYTGALEINYKGAKTAAEQQERYTEGMNNLYASMLQSTGGLDQFRMAGESSSQAIQRLTAEALNLASASGYSAETVANTIRDGLLGRMSGSEVGVALGDIMLDSIYNALASGFAEQITASITGMIIQPLMTAVLTGGAISGAVNAASIATVRGQAIATVNAFKQMLADPAIQGLFKEIQSLSTDLGKIIGSAASVTKVKTTSMKRSYSSAVNTAQSAADQIKSAWESIFNSLTDQIDKLKNDILGESDIAATYSQAKFNAAIAAAMAGDQDAAKSLPQLAQGVIDIAKATVTNLSDLRAVQGATLQQLQTVQQSLSSKYGFAIPAFAVGTNYVQKDMIAQIHEGEAIVPKAYNPAAGGSGAIPSADMQPVTLRLDQLIAILNRIDKSTRELSNNFDNVTEGGNFMRTSVV